MRSVLDLAGFFLFLVYRIVMLPVLTVLYALLAVVVFYKFSLATGQQVRPLLAQSIQALRTVRHRLNYFHKWSLSSLLQKTWAFANHSH